MKKLGVIGGLGPLASVYFYGLLTKMQAVHCEQDYLDIVLYSKPSTPDRSAFINGISSEDPVPSLTEAGLTLVNAAVDVIAIPCVTAHYFYDRIAQKIQVPILHIVEETVRHISEAGIKKAGLLATDGTLKSGLFRDALHKRDIDVITPSDDEQVLLMKLIYDAIKRGKACDEKLFTTLATHLRERGAETVIIGCTDLSTMQSGLESDIGFTDALTVLARASLLYCGAEVREYAD